MLLEGSCHCGAVRFSVEAYAPVPYLRCYCSVCRKTAGGGGYAVNLGAKAGTLRVEGRGRRISVPRQDRRRGEPGRTPLLRARCGSALWVSDRRWPDLVHPFASTIDTPLLAPPECEHIMLGSKAGWVRIDARRTERRYDDYPQDSLEDWHRRHGLLDDG